jgi:hypothetical protein
MTSLTFFEVTGTYFAVADPAVSGTINDPIVQAVSGLVSFTPRLPVGFQGLVAGYEVQAAYNAEQTVSIIGNAVQGTWTLTFGNATTTTLQYNASPSTVASALAALPTIGAGNVTVVADVNPQAYQVRFGGTLAGTSLDTMIANWSNLTDANGYDCEITVAATAQGGPQIIADTSVSIPVRSARIWNGVLSTIDYVDSPGVMLTADIPALNIPAAYEPLIYDVAYSAVTFNGESQTLANVAFQAPMDATPVCITSPSAGLLNWQKPITDIWTPQAPATLAVVNWRARAGAVA